MAQRSGFFGTLGGLFRLAIWVLAAIFAVTIWIWYTGDNDTVAVTEPAPDVTPARASETPESVAAEEETTPVPNPVETDGATLPEGTGLAETRPVDGAASEEAAAPAGEAEAASLVEGAVAGATQSASETVAGADGERPLTIPMPEPMTTIEVIGDNTAVYAFVDAVRGEDGAIELTTTRTENGETTYVTRRVTCDPLAADVVAEGPDLSSLVTTDGLTEPAPVAEGSPEAVLASYACSLEF